MKRLSIIGLAAAAAIALSLGAAAPAQAKVFFSFGVGHGYGYGYGFHHPYYYGPRYYCGLRSVRVKIRRHHHWQWVRTVRRVCY